MLNSITIENYKSIQKETFDLKRVNVFIGKNGCGKSNILEAIAMASEAVSNPIIEIENIANRGVRIARPAITINSFMGIAKKQNINFQISSDEYVVRFHLTPSDDTDIFASWNISVDSLNELLIEKLESDQVEEIKLHIKNQFMPKFRDEVTSFVEKGKLKQEGDLAEVLTPFMDSLFAKMEKQIRHEHSFDQRIMAHVPKRLHEFTIYSINTQALRGLNPFSKRQPLGIYGEGLDLLLQVMSKEEKEELYSNMDLIDWLEQFEIHADSEYLGEGHKLGRSSSSLYFKDKFMQKKNNIFSAENANEGALHVLFYLALIISKRTPSIFAIDNIESSLNPKLCTEVMKRIMTLAEKHNKQILITTHNPAILDGINLASDQQALFVVDRNDHGMTVADQIKTKKELKNRLSELWMSGVLGGVPTNF